MQRIKNLSRKDKYLNKDQYLLLLDLRNASLNKLDNNINNLQSQLLEPMQKR